MFVDLELKHMSLNKLHRCQDVTLTSPALDWVGEPGQGMWHLIREGGT